MPLDDFQLHGMKCDRDRIVVFGWDRNSTIALADSGGPRVIVHETTSTLGERDRRGRVVHRNVVHTGAAKEVVH